jgi:hypothetical protein
MVREAGSSRLCQTLVLMRVSPAEAEKAAAAPELYDDGTAAFGAAFWKSPL